MGGTSRTGIVIAILVVVLYAGIGGYLVFSEQLSSYQFMMIGAAAGIICSLLGFFRQ